MMLGLGVGSRDTWFTWCCFILSSSVESASIMHESVMIGEYINLGA